MQACNGLAGEIPPPLSVVTKHTDHASLEIVVNSGIASPFSRQIVNGNVGPTTALPLDSMGPKPTFHCHWPKYWS